MKHPTHKWEFRARFRANAYGWNGSRLAAQRLKEALSEIRAVARKEPVTAAEGAIVLMEKLWPALANVDTSSGMLGSATNKAVHELVDLVVAAPADEALRDKWLDRLQTAVDEDGVDYLYEVRERWGELCGSAELASRTADELLPVVRMTWREGGSYFAGTSNCLSCLLESERYVELVALVDSDPYEMWHYRRFAVEAMRRMGKIDEAIDYATDSSEAYVGSTAIARACEEILIEAGRADEAYARFGHDANRATTHLATCRALVKKYPHKEPRTILADLIATSPGEEGKWFAAAKTLGHLDLAADLAQRSPVNIATLLRAARDFAEKTPEFALAAATAALHWMARGEFYEITAADVWDAKRLALAVGQKLGRLEEVERLIAEMAGDEGTEEFVRERLR